MQKTGFIRKLYIDFDGFFASAEQHLNPELRGVPVGIIPLDSNHSGCIAASYEAKRCGVSMGTSQSEARLLCPGIRFVVARHDVYVRLHHQIVAVVNDCVPVSGVRSIDEAVCDLLPSESRNPLELGRTVKAQIANRIGPALSCSAGLATTELLAKVAAEIEKPDGLVVFAPGDMPGRLLDLALTDFPGISRGIERRLHAAGVNTVGELWALAAKQMRAIWGSVEGERFWASLHGYEVERPATTRRMFGHSRVLPVDWRTPQRILMCARLLLGSAARRLRREGRRACNLSYSLRGAEGVKWSAEARFTAARDDATFLHALQKLHHDFLDQAPFRKAKSVTVTLHGLVADLDRGGSGFMEDLFEDGHSERARRWEAVSDSMDALRVRYGAGAVTLGPHYDMPGGYVGGKIAFNHIPELSDFDDTASHHQRAIIRL